MLAFISFWRVAAVVLNDMGSSAFYAGAIAEHFVGKTAPWFVLAIMLLAAIAGACLGLFIGTSIRPEQIGLMFALIFTPLIFTGCTYYPWGLLDGIRWFQIITLFNPLTYAAEGLRHAMVPPIAAAPGAPGTVPFSTLELQWVLLGLAVTIVAFFFLGVRTFRRRVIS